MSQNNLYDLNYFLNIRNKNREMKENLIISGKKQDFELIMNRLIKKYGKDASLLDVIKKEYGKTEVILN
jgi:hypothetical protein